MPTRVAEPEQPGVGAAAKQVAEHASTLAKLELELAGLELKQKVGSLGAGLGLGIGAALLGLYALGFLFATIAAALSIFLDTWLALLLVTAGLLALYAVGFLFATIAVALALLVATWLALVIVTVGLLFGAGLLGLLAVRRIKRGTPPVPEQAIREAKLTSEALKANGHH